MTLDRIELLVYVDTDVTDSTPDYELIGFGSEEMNIDYNFESEDKTDIYGINYKDNFNPKPTISVDPFDRLSGSKLFEVIEGIIDTKQYKDLSKFNVLIVKGYRKPAVGGGFFAELHKGCTITPESLGGAVRLQMPFELALSDNKILGTVTSNDFRTETVEFTATV